MLETTQTIKEQAIANITERANKIAARFVANDNDVNEMMRTGLKADLTRDEFDRALRASALQRSTIATYTSHYAVIKSNPREAQRLADGITHWRTAYMASKTPRYQPPMEKIYRLANEVADEIKAGRTTLESFNELVDRILKHMETR